MKVKFTIPGPPIGKGRPRFARRGKYVSTYTPQKTVKYEKQVQMEYRRQCGTFCFSLEAALDMRIIAYFPIPKSDSKKIRKMKAEHKIRPTSKPDVDNLYKVIADSLNEVAYHDDAKIVDGQIRKFYSEEPRVVVTIQEVEMNG